MSISNSFPSFVTDVDFSNYSFRDLREYRKALFEDVISEARSEYHRGVWKWYSDHNMTLNEELTIISKKFCSEKWDIINRIDFMLESDKDLKYDNETSLKEQGLEALFEGATFHSYACECMHCNASLFSSLEEVTLVSYDESKLYFVECLMDGGISYYYEEVLIEVDAETECLTTFIRESIFKKNKGIVIAFVPFLSLDEDKKNVIREDIETMIV